MSLFISDSSLWFGFIFHNEHVFFSIINFEERKEECVLNSGKRRHRDEYFYNLTGEKKVRYLGV